MENVFLDIQNLSVQYQNEGATFEVIKSLSLKVQGGDFVAILGPSGCGKTTLLNTIVGINSDLIVKDGNVLSSGKIRIVFQEPRLLPWYTVLENICYGLSASEIQEKKNETAKLIDSFGLADFIGFRPEKLSLGMKQRVNLARAIITGPDILLLDEPFSSLDTQTKKKIMADLKLVVKNKMAVIFVTHSWEEAFFMADRILVLSKSPATEIATLPRNKYDSYKDAKKALEKLHE